MSPEANATAPGAELRALAGRAAWDELLARHAEDASRWREFVDARPGDAATLAELRKLIALHEELIGRAMRARADCMAELAALGRGGHARHAYESTETAGR